jgi:hypothetical protein
MDFSAGATYVRPNHNSRSVWPSSRLQGGDLRSAALHPRDLYVYRLVPIQFSRFDMMSESRGLIHLYGNWICFDHARGKVGEPKVRPVFKEGIKRDRSVLFSFFFDCIPVLFPTRVVQEIETKLWAGLLGPKRDRKDG